MRAIGPQGLKPRVKASPSNCFYLCGGPPELIVLVPCARGAEHLGGPTIARSALPPRNIGRHVTSDINYQTLIGVAEVMRHRQAFTLVELLVVIAIIGLLVSILVPAVQSARGAARRMQCSSNLRQIGIAFASYHDALGGYPLSMTSGGGSDGADGSLTGHFSWMAMILPYVEQLPLHQQIDFNITMADQPNEPFDGMISAEHPNAAAASTIVPVYLCPADGEDTNSVLVMGTANAAADSYAANAGWPSYATGYDGERSHPGEYNGLITLANMQPNTDISWHPHRAIRVQDVTDGLSNTAAVSERLIMRGNNVAEIQASDDRLQSYHLSEAPRTLPQMISASKLNPHSDPVFSAFQGRSWISGWTLTAPTYMHVFTPNTISMHLHDGVSTGDNLITPSSYHPGGVNVLMGDGHVVFVTDEVDQRTWWALGSRNDGALVNLEK